LKSAFHSYPIAGVSSLDLPNELSYYAIKAKETKKCLLHRDVADDDLVEFCQL
jgi:hypothetical protein